ncbi:MAG: DUF1013 domain-containing protein, partial [Planktomarina sp.]|nr:DUF1013 domain-containing protein [Planktomarina sp.]
ISGLETFTLAEDPKSEEGNDDVPDADSFFNLPGDKKD